MQFLGPPAPSSPGCSDAVSAGQQKLARGGMGKEFRRTASHQDWHVWSLPPGSISSVKDTSPPSCSLRPHKRR